MFAIIANSLTLLHAFSPQELNNVPVDPYKRSGLLECKTQGPIAQAASRRERKEKYGRLDKKVFKAIKKQILKMIVHTIIRQTKYKASFWAYKRKEYFTYADHTSIKQV